MAPTLDLPDSAISPRPDNTHNSRWVRPHHSFPQAAQEKARWLKRYAAFAVDSGVPAADAERAIAAISAQLPVLSPEEDAALISRAGFEGVELFYTGFSFKGWVGYKLR